MRTTSCPYCYARIDAGRLGFLCTGRGSPGRRGCERVRDADRERETGYQLPARPFFLDGGRGWLPTRLVPARAPTTGVAAARSLAARSRPGRSRAAGCPDCGAESGIRACPSCHSPMPAGFGESPSPLIAMVGAKGTGKTVYLTVLAHELLHGLRRRFDADVRPTGDVQGEARSPLQWLEGNVDAVFDAKRLFPATEAARQGRRSPVVFAWRQERRRLGRPVLRTSYLSFYDTAGEDLTSQDRTHDLRYLGSADALIVLLDPFTIGRARDQIAVPDLAVRSREPADQVLSRVTEMLRSALGTPSGKKVDVPVAVAFAKVDAFFDLLGADHPLVRTPPAEPWYDEPAGRDLHEHVRALLEEWGADDIDAHLRLNYTTFRYFGVSALGAEPDYERNLVDPGGVRPHRVGEPLVWLLSRFGVVATGPGR